MMRDGRREFVQEPAGVALLVPASLTWSQASGRANDIPNVFGTFKREPGEPGSSEKYLGFCEEVLPLEELLCDRVELRRLGPA